VATDTKELFAQYFTPPAVVAFAYDALARLGMTRPPARVIDPACGNGVFLRPARERFPAAELWGCDLDGTLVKAWAAMGLYADGMHLLVRDGLHDAPADGVAEGTFDLVVGNPPYGHGVPRPSGSKRIEALFLRRFVALARPGGWIAIVVPEGIVANASSQTLRDGVLREVALRAVVELPEVTFRQSGTRARTLLLLACRQPAEHRDTALVSPCGRTASGDLAAYLNDALALLNPTHT